MASKAGDLSAKYSQEEMNKFREECIRFLEESNREKMARDEVIINSNDRDSKIEEDYTAEEMNIIANEKMLRRRNERLMRHFRRRQTSKKNSKSSAEESFTSDSDEKETKIAALDEVKRLMEKAIQENMTSTARDEVINTNDGDVAAKMEDSKAEEMNMADEKMFPRRRERLIRYLRRQKSKSEDSAFQIEFHHLQLPMAEESFMSYSDESEEMNKAHD